MTKAYEEALEESRKASREFMAVQQAYRAGETSDQTFLEAKAKHDAACKVFDAAYAKEAA